MVPTAASRTRPKKRHSPAGRCLLDGSSVLAGADLLFFAALFGSAHPVGQLRLVMGGGLAIHRACFVSALTPESKWAVPLSHVASIAATTSSN